MGTETHSGRQSVRWSGTASEDDAAARSAAPPAEPRPDLESSASGLSRLSQPGEPVVVDLRPSRDLFNRRRWRERSRSVGRTLVLMVGDAGSAAAAVLLAALPFGDPVRGSAAAAAIPLAGLLAVLFQAAAGTYGPGPARRRYERAFFFGGCAAVVFSWAVHSYGLVALSLPRVVLLTVSLGGLVLGVRVLIDVLLRWMRSHDVAISRTVIIGEPGSAQEILRRASFVGASQIRVVGWIAASLNGNGRDHDHHVNGNGSHASNGAGRNGKGRSSGIVAGPPPLLGSLSDLARVLELYDIRSVIISAHLRGSELKAVLESCLLRGCRVGLVPETVNEVPCQVSASDFLGWPLLELQIPRLHVLQSLAKRGLDLVGSTAGLVLLSPLLAAVAVAVRLDSPGPILFRQRRLGVGGRSFAMYKFRTMRQDAERLLREDPALFELYQRNDYKLPEDRDPRITRFGRFLRAWSLDELPQLLNVLRGDMSLVGPRPIVPEEIDYYGDYAGLFLGVRPGITGQWQVNGRSEIGYPERAHIDIQYIKNWSLGRDLEILTKTIPVVLRRHGAH